MLQISQNKVIDDNNYERSFPQMTPETLCDVCVLDDLGSPSFRGHPFLVLLYFFLQMPSLPGFCLPHGQCKQRLMYASTEKAHYK